MSTPHPDQIAALVDALREDLPDAHERERVRARLIAAGVALSGGVAASGAASAAASATATATMGTGAASSGAQLGLWPKLVSLSFAQKVGVAVVLISAGGALPATPKLIEIVERAGARTAGVDAASSAKRVRTVRAHVGVPAAVVRDSVTRETLTADARIAEPIVQAAAPDALAVAVSGSEATRGAARSMAATTVLTTTATQATERERMKDASNTSPGVPAAAEAGRAVSPGKPQHAEGTSNASHDAPTADDATRGPAPAGPDTIASAVAPTSAATAATYAARAEAQPDSARADAKAALAANNGPAADETRTAPAVSPLASTLAARLSPAAAARAASTLRNETELLEHALAAIAAGDQDTARAWLDLHSQRFPHGLLQRERERALRHLAPTRTGALPNPTTGASTP